MNSQINNIKALRKKRGLTQEEVAKIIEVSVPTYIKIEKGITDISLKQAEGLAALLHINILELLQAQSTDNAASNIAVIEKYKQIIQSAIKFGADKDGKIPKTKLAKLVYLSDFIWYYIHKTPLSGVAYRKLSYGPVANLYFRAIDELEDDGYILRQNTGKASLYSLTSNSDTPGSLLTKAQLELIKKVGSGWRNKHTDDIVKFTHAQLPWQICNEDEYIPYDLIFQEEPEKIYGPVKL